MLAERRQERLGCCEKLEWGSAFNLPPRYCPQHHQQLWPLHPPCGEPESWLPPDFGSLRGLSATPQDGYRHSQGLAGEGCKLPPPPLPLLLDCGLNSPLCTRMGRAWPLVTLPWPGTGQVGALRGVFFFQSNHNSFIISHRLLAQFRSS